MFLTVIDAHSKWMVAFAMTTSTPSASIEKLRIAFATHGLPEMVVTHSNSALSSFVKWISREDGANLRGLKKEA